MPRSTQRCMAAQISRRLTRTSSSPRQAFSFSNIICAMLNPVRADCASSSLPLWNG
jgi:hypothetical protein